MIDRGGDDGRLVIDARTGRILRFMPADRMGDNFNEDMPHLRPGRAAAAAEPRQGRPAAAGLDPACREPHAGADAETAADAPMRSSRLLPNPRYRAGAAIGRGAAEAGRCATDPAGCGSHRRPGQTRRAADPADAGNAEGAGAGVEIANASRHRIIPGHAKASNLGFLQHLRGSGPSDHSPE